MFAIGQGIEDQVDFTVADHGGDVLTAFMDLADDVDGHAVIVEVGAGAFGGDDVVAQFLKAFGQMEGFGFIAVG